MKFARIVFWVAGIFGLVTLAPLYFLFDRVGVESPPAVTHPEFYFGFAGLGLVWQLAFIIIATNPVRFRPMMIAAMLEKVSFIAAMVVLLLQHRVTAAQALSSVPDALLCALFVIAYVRTPESGEGR